MGSESVYMNLGGVINFQKLWKMQVQVKFKFRLWFNAIMLLQQIFHFSYKYFIWLSELT